MKRSRYLMALVLAALVGVALQVWCQTAGFDPVTRLVVPGSPALLATGIYFGLVPVAFLLFSLALRGSSAPGRGELFGNLGFVGRFLGVLAGLLWLAGGGLRLREDVTPLLYRRWVGLGDCLVDGLLCLGGVCLIWLALSRKNPRPQSLLTLIPGFGACFWLITFYHTQSRDPIVARYIWTLLCLMAAVLALYHQAAYCFGRPAPVRTLFFTLTAGAWAFGALPSATELSQALLLTGLGCWMLLHSLLIPNAPAPAEAPQTPEAPEDPQSSSFPEESGSDL